MEKCTLCNLEFENLKELTRHLVDHHSYSIEQIYSYHRYSFENKSGLCPICGKQFQISSKQLRKHKKQTSYIGCCLSCSSSLRSMFKKSPFLREDVRAKAKETMLNRYGVAYSLQSEEVREKQKATILERHGVDNAMKLSSSKEKAKITNLNKFGVEHPAQSLEIQEKIKRTNLNKFGVEHPAQSLEIQEKIKKTNIIKFGVPNVSQSEEVKRKKKQTTMSKYGVEHVSQIPEVKEKVQESLEETNLEKYGVRRPMQSLEVQEKAKITNLERFGVEYSITAEEVKEKIKKTNSEKFGYENPLQNPEIRERIKRTNLELYGYKHASQSPEVMDKIRESNLQKYGVEYFCQHEKCIEAGGSRVSKYNKDFSEWLLEHNIQNDLEFIVGNVGYDLKVGNTLIEINPYYTHNSTKGPCFGQKERNPKEPDYHLKKTNIAIENGYRCVHIFDWDDKIKILNLFQEKAKIFARNCEVREMLSSEANKFLTMHHLQGSTKGVKFACGLYYNKELVQVMTFGTPRYNKNYEYELLRLCSLPAFNIVGGASKLMSFFESAKNPTSTISYCDFSKFTGEVYKNLGFSLINKTAPAKHWYNPKTKVHITDNLLRQRGFDQLHKTSFGKGTSNDNLMLEHGYLEIYDCGQLVFTKTME